MEWIEERTEFQNVDLDIASHQDLAPLVAALGSAVVALHVGRHGKKGRYWARIELSVQPKSCGEAIRRFAALLNRLPRPARRLWSQARSKELNVGVQVGRQPHASELVIDPAVVIAVARLGARLAFTIYSPFVSNTLGAAQPSDGTDGASRRPRS